jgi:hypothetical protein
VKTGWSWQTVEASKPMEPAAFPYNDPQFGTFPEELYLHLPVYNLEVEDFHTYYVGEHGIWVHNTNCGGLKFEVNSPPAALNGACQVCVINDLPMDGHALI